MKTVIICVFSIFFSLPTLLNAATSHLTMGIFPYASTSKLVAHHKNIKKHLNSSDVYQISLVTASDVPTYISNVKSFKYDLVYSAPHLARYLEKKYGYQPVAMTTHQIRGVFITQKKSTIVRIEDLKNKTISIAPEKTILHQAALHKFNKNNLINGKNIHINVVNTHNNAIFNVVNGTSDAAVTGIKLWKKLSQRHKKELREFALTKPTTGFIVLAKPDISKEIIKDLEQSFLSFNKTPAGKTYLFKGFTAITEEAMKSLDFYSRVFE